MNIKANDFEALCETVRHNCHVSDARHASDYSLCIYLMKMREYCRWEKGYDFSAKLPAAEVGRWLDAREQLWDDLQEKHADYRPLLIGGRSFDPFDNEAINERLNPYGYVYSGGLGVRAVPHFFLADLGQQKQWRQHTVLISDREYARDLASPPAMRLANTIFIRRQSLQRMLWEKYCEWNLSLIHI